MIPSRSIRIRKMWLWILIISCGIVAACVGFISIVSIWIGLRHSHQAGSWVPVLGGALSFILVSWLFLLVRKHILRQIREEDFLNY
jgi:hypothetical protein